MSGLFRKCVVLDKAADFRRVDAGVFRKGPANAVADVIIVVLGASEAELTQERPIRAVLVLHLEDNRATADPDVRIANP